MNGTWFHLHLFSTSVGEENFAIPRDGCLLVRPVLRDPTRGQTDSSVSKDSSTVGKPGSRQG
jgi:hypothetical protein